VLSQHWILDFLRQIGTLVENIKEGTLNLILLKMVLHSPPLVSSNVVLVRRLETGVQQETAVSEEGADVATERGL